MKRFVLLVAVILLFAGCAGRINKTMKSWMGAHKSQLIRSWGPPTRVADDGQGGEVLIYEYHESFQTQGKATTQKRGGKYVTTYQPGQTINVDKYRMFWADENGVLYGWKWKGL